MIRSLLFRRSVILVLVVLFGLALRCHLGAQDQRVELLLPGDDYHRDDLPADPSGFWWVLHQPDSQPVLESMLVVVTPFRTCGDGDVSRQTGRAVEIPAARDTILLVRGLPSVQAGVVRTAFVDSSGAGESERVETSWDDTTVVVQRKVEGPVGDEPGQYWVELLIGTERYRLHTDQWHGDGHWRVRWIGDLNRDGWPDLLLDASYKYSVTTTRLYLSRAADGQPAFAEIAILNSAAC